MIVLIPLIVALILAILALAPLIGTVIINGAISSASGGGGGGGTPGPSVTVSTSLTWSPQGTGTAVAPDTDTGTDCRAMTSLLVDCDLSTVTGAMTGSFLLIASVTSSTSGFGDGTNPYVTIVTTLAAGARVVRAVTVPGGWIKGRLTIAGAAIPAATSAIMRIYTLK